MIKNYFIIAVRNFWRNKVFSLINITGLSIGISAALVIYLVVQYDFSFDTFEKGNNRIYRVVADLKNDGEPFAIGGVPLPLAGAVRNELTGIEQTTEFLEYSGSTVTIPTTNAQKSSILKGQSDIIFADEHYFNLLSYKWLAGSPETALKEPFKVVLSEERAKLYFPSQPISDIIGSQIIFGDSLVTTVSGIVKEFTENTDFRFKEFISFATIPASKLKREYSWDQWGNISSSSQLFVKLTIGNSIEKTETQLKALLNKYNTKAVKDENNYTTFRLQPLSDLHFNSVYGTFGEHTAHKPALYGLLTLAIFLLLLGCINFINLTTAQASRRAKEIGIRKTMGSSRNQLMLQLLSETFFITVMSTELSVLIAPLLLKIFADFIPKEVHFDILRQPHVILFLTGLVIIVSFLSGFYPALVLSRYNPVKVLKNQAYQDASISRKAWMRKGLTISQFFIAQVFIMAALVTGRQIHYILNTDMGFKKDGIILFRAPVSYDKSGRPDGKRFVLLNKLKSMPGIQMISLGNGAPSSSGLSLSTMTYTDGKKEIKTEVQRKNGDTNYINLYQIKLLAGRNVQYSDTIKEYLINETYLHTLGFQNPQAVLNKNINGIPVVGVMADFHQQSLHAPIKPLVFFTNNNNNDIHIALKPQVAGEISWAATIGKIEKAYKSLYPGDDFYYQFFDESIAQLYKSEQDMSRLLTWATGLAIPISCLGLLGLVIYTTNQRTKEIGVRKVLGASITQIVSILSKDFVTLVIIAFVIAAPVAWWATNKWLENYAYKATISWWLFLLSGILMTIIALLTLSVQTIRAASANPVKSLRTE